MQLSYSDMVLSLMNLQGVGKIFLHLSYKYLHIIMNSRIETSMRMVHGQRKDSNITKRH